MSKRAAIIAAEGFGDGLIMLIAEKYLTHEGFSTTLYNRTLSSFKDWIGVNIKNYEDNIEEYLHYDLLILQHDNSQRAKKIIELAHPEKLIIFYPTYKEEKHGSLNKHDIPFNSNITMAENVAKACKMIFHMEESKEIPIRIPISLIFRKHKQRVVIHPTSTDPHKNWSKKKYLKLADRLKEEGYEPHFVLSFKERDYLIDERVHLFDKISDLAAFIYESAFLIGNDSGPSHLASYFHIPFITLADDEKRMRLWQGGWKKGTILTPNLNVLKWIKFRKTHWSNFISVKRVIKSLRKLTKTAL